MEYRIKTTIVADIEISLVAESAEAAERIVHDSLAVNAVLIDIDPLKWDTIEDSITEINGTTIETVEEEAA